MNQPLPFDRRRRADLTFTRAKLYVFVDGCFWHGCPDHFIQPKTRADFWRIKIHNNRERDKDTDRRLASTGATVLRIWEHQDPRQAADFVEATYLALVRPSSRPCATLGAVPLGDEAACGDV